MLITDPAYFVESSMEWVAVRTSQMSAKVLSVGKRFDTSRLFKAIIHQTTGTAMTRKRVDKREGKKRVEMDTHRFLSFPTPGCSFNGLIRRPEV